MKEKEEESTPESRERRKQGMKKRLVSFVLSELLDPTHKHKGPLKVADARCISNWGGCAIHSLTSNR